MRSSTPIEFCLILRGQLHGLGLNETPRIDFGHAGVLPPAVQVRLHFLSLVIAPSHLQRLIHQPVVERVPKDVRMQSPLQVWETAFHKQAEDSVHGGGIKRRSPTLAGKQIRMGSWLAMLLSVT